MTKTSNEDRTNRSGYVSEADHQDQERNNKITNMQELIDEGLASGISDSSMDDILVKGKSYYTSINDNE